MKIIFRVDASSQIGTGHVVRCLTLAKILKKQGAKCKFFCRDHKNNLIEKIKKEGFETVTLINSGKVIFKQSAKIVNNNYSNWIGTTWKQDVNQTIYAIEKEKIDWLIVDHYGIDKKWEVKIRPHVQKILVIDDLANRNHDCDLLLDQNLVANFKNRYQNLLPKHSNTLLGPKYALLQNQYKNLYSRATPRSGMIKRILVHFGGTDQYAITKLVILNILKLNQKNIILDIVTNLKTPEKKKIKILFKKNKKVKIYNDLNTLAHLILKADLAVGACGTTSLERCCLGLPSLVITIADNQIPIAKELHKKKLIHWLGHYDKITDNLVYSGLKNSINQNLKVWSNACKLVTDGCGAEKVASIITLNSKTKLKLRLVRSEDKKLLLNWANDPLVRSNAFNSKIISERTHNKWFNFNLNNQKICKIFIVETKDGIPIGQVRFEKKNRKWYINYSLSSFARGKKIASKILLTSINKFKKNHKNKLYAKVKKDNLPSCKAFEKIGFKKNYLNVYDLGIINYKL